MTAAARSLPVVQDYVNAAICAECGGSCCKSLPGSALPEDFGAPDRAELRRQLTDALNSGRWALDWWEGDPRKGRNRLSCAYFVRPAVVGHEGQRAHGAWGGTCTFLTDTGCSIFDVRPTGCRGLEPIANRELGCKVHYGDKQEAAIAWLPYRALLRELLYP